MSYLEDTADELADMAIAEAKACDDEKIIAQIGDLLGASSQSLQEAFMLAIRIRRAEARVRTLLAESAANRSKS